MTSMTVPRVGHLRSALSKVPLVGLLALLFGVLLAGPAAAQAPADGRAAAPVPALSGSSNNRAHLDAAGKRAAPVAIGRLAPDAADAVAQIAVPYPECSLGFRAGNFPVLAPGTHTFDTDALTLDGNPVTGAVATGGVAVFPFVNITVPAGVVIRGVGSRPLALLSHGPITIAGTVQVDGSSATPTAPGCQPRTASPGGAGGGAGGLGLLAGPGVGQPGVGPGGGFVPLGNFAGGGGGGFGGAGGAGGANGAAGGAGGPAYGNLASNLQGGSGGAAGSASSSCSAASGGGAGGAVLLSSPSTITIAGGGLVSANGGNGALSDTGASGGGSGGGIVLVAQNVNNGGTLRANGGVGGSGGCCGGGGAGGGGRIHVSAFAITVGGTQVAAGGASSGNAGGAAGVAGVVTQDLQGLLYRCQSDMAVNKACYARPLSGPPTNDPDVLYAGQQWICDITISHRFLGEADYVPGVFIQDFALTDTFPAGLTYVVTTVATEMNGNVGAAPVCSAPPLAGPGTINCSGLDLQTGGSDTFQIAFTSSPSFVATAPTGELPVTNTACLVLPLPVLDVNAANDCGSDTDIVKDLADLRITKFVEPFGTVRAGQVFTYTIFVDNLGPSTARTAVISDTLLSSGNVSIQSCAFSVSQGGGSITQFTCTTGNLVSTQFGSDIGTFATSFLEPLTPDSQGRLRASFRLVANQDIKVTNTARVTSLTPDPDMSNNFTSTFLAVTGVTNLA
ncbi:MAG: DUF11 domain-containing protein [Ardenticatenia bacterium]|nr:DUF11 domain-containing protein [Ardenticatenia bacterium]